MNNRNAITIGLDTQTIFYQNHLFYTGQNIQILTYPQINKYNAFFIIQLLKKQMVKFNWGGNGATLTRLKKIKIFFPINTQGEIDYEYMENYTKNIETEQLQKYLTYIGNKIDQN